MDAGTTKRFLMGQLKALGVLVSAADSSSTCAISRNEVVRKIMLILN